MIAKAQLVINANPEEEELKCHSPIKIVEKNFRKAPEDSFQQMVLKGMGYNSDRSRGAN